LFAVASLISRQRRHVRLTCLRDFSIECMLRDVRVHQLLEGTNKVMRLIVSRDLLGN
jgi:alkylation response protein AidB-like acyl-CoA dehydrogenase